MLITGTSRGIGLYLAEHYSLSGLSVVGCSRGAAEFQHERYTHFALDISDEASVTMMFAAIRKKFGCLDVLINNAGAFFANFALLTPGDTMKEVFATNAIGGMIVSREASKLMRKNAYGRIINVSSIHVPLALPGTTIYGSSKAALEHFSRVLAREVYSDGITVNTLALSVVENSGMAASLSNETISTILENTVTKSAIVMGDIPHVIDFLISPLSEKITDQRISL